MKSSLKPGRLVVAIIVSLVVVLPLAWSRLASAGSFSISGWREAAGPMPLFAAYTVDNLGDTGAGTGTTGDLRYCITQANAAGGTNTISFSVTGTITLLSALPTITNDLTI